ncbi:MAG: hypothetical protein ABTD50_08370 [Polyangiaceae bacterium]|jgi:hypothetical protein
MLLRGIDGDLEEGLTVLMASTLLLFSSTNLLDDERRQHDRPPNPWDK